MKLFIIGHLKKIPKLYYFLRDKAAYINYKLPAKVQIKNIFRKINNLLNNIDWQTTCEKSELPKQSLVEITNACNLNCVMCNTKMTRRPIGFMKPQTFEMILQQLKGIGITEIGLHTVGEPFMYKDLEELLEIAEKSKVSVWLSTNGQFPDRIKQLHKNFPNLANSYRFSIDGATREVYEHIRRGASFDKLIESLEVIYKINHGKKNYRIRVTVSSILSTDNIYELPEFFKIYGKYCWPKNINFNLVNGLSPDSNYFKKTFPFPNLIRYNVPCKMPFEDIYFTYSGKVTLCCRDYEEELVVGDIHEKSITEIWNSQLAENIREKNINPDMMDINACRMCFGPYGVVSDIMNQYIHFLILTSRGLNNQEFGSRLLSLLNKMNFLMPQDKKIFKQAVLSAFKGC